MTSVNYAHLQARNEIKLASRALLIGGNYWRMILYNVQRLLRCCFLSNDNEIYLEIFQTVSRNQRIQLHRQTRYTRSITSGTIFQELSRGTVSKLKFVLCFEIKEMRDISY